MPGGTRGALTRLNSLAVGTYREVPSLAKVTAITRLSGDTFSHTYRSIAGEMAIWTIRGVGSDAEECLLAGVHLTSKAGGARDDDQLVAAVRVIDELRDFEDNCEHLNTVIVGDFNMNPYDPGMTNVVGIHGLMTRGLAKKKDRVHQKRPYRRFYNPMWGFFGDRTPGPAGTYYWHSTTPHNSHWQMFDQVLVRKALIDRLGSVRVLDHDGSHPLTLPDGMPDRERFSDHLPIIFTLDL